jgi:hypothetical protein
MAFASCKTFSDIRNVLEESTSFPREQKRALITMLDLASYRHVVKKDTIQLCDLKTQDERFFTLASVYPPHLPREPSWQWNQSRGKTRYVFGEILEVSMCKLNTRRQKNHQQKPPPYKIWALSLKFYGSEACNFVWCERGECGLSFHLHPAMASPKAECEKDIESLEVLPTELEPSLDELEMMRYDPGVITFLENVMNDLSWCDIFGDTLSFPYEVEPMEKFIW